MTDPRSKHAISLPEWWGDALRQFDTFAALPAGWDSHGAPPPPPAVVRAAERWLEAICDMLEPIARPYIHPTPAGGIQFEWESGAGYVEVEVGSENSVAFFYQEASTGHEREGVLRADDPLDDLLAWIKHVTAGA